MKKEDNMLKSKMICGRKSAWVYKNFEMEKICYLEQNTIFVLSFNYTDKREAELFYHYLFYIMLGSLVVLHCMLFMHSHSWVLERDRNIAD